MEIHQEGVAAVGATGPAGREGRSSFPVSGMMRRMAAVIAAVLRPPHTEDILTWAKLERVKWYPGCGR
jgi:hypothetical protein